MGIITTENRAVKAVTDKDLRLPPNVDREQLEQGKSLLTEVYEADIEELYKEIMQEILRWFRFKFPKRKLKWVSGMGSCFWVLDGEILHWEVLVETHDDHGYQTGYKEPEPDRKQRLLKPLWDFFQSIHDHTNYLGRWIHIGDHSTEDLK